MGQQQCNEEENHQEHNTQISGAAIWLVWSIVIWTIIILSLSFVKACRAESPVVFPFVTYCPTMLGIQEVQRVEYLLDTKSKHHEDECRQKEREFFSQEEREVRHGY